MARRRNEIVNPRPLPTTVAELDTMRVIKRERDFNDAVEDLHRSLFPDPAYRALLEAVIPEQTVEGSIGADTICAAQMIREKADQMKIAMVKDAQLAVIAKSIGTVMRRYKTSRKQRREAPPVVQAAE